MTHPRFFAFLAIVLTCLLPFMAAAEEERRIPTFKECKMLGDEKTPTKDKVLLQLSFFPRLPWCEITTRPFKAFNVFSPGTTEVRLKLFISEKDVYELTGDSLVAALMPDRTKASGAQAAQLAGQMFSLIMGAMNAAVDPFQMTILIGRMGTVAGAVGANAALVEKEMVALRARHNFQEADIKTPEWLTNVAGGKGIKQALEGTGREPKNFVEKFFRAVGKLLRALGIGLHETNPAQNFLKPPLI